MSWAFLKKKKTGSGRSQIIVNGLLVICSSVFMILLIELLGGGLLTHKIKQFHNQRHPSVEAHAAYAQALLDAIPMAIETVKIKRGGTK